MAAKKTADSRETPLRQSTTVPEDVKNASLNVRQACNACSLAAPQRHANFPEPPCVIADKI